MPPISPAEPVTQLRSVKIIESGEPLVDFLKLCPALRLDRPRFHYRRETLLRVKVAEKLCEATNRLPDGFHIAVIEGWRAPHIQRRMYAALWNRFKEQNPDWTEVKLKRVVNRYTAPMDSRVPPPHTTGGAMDLCLIDSDGNAYDLIAPFEAQDPRGFAFDAPGLSEAARRNRDLLANALASTGITNYPSEYWHFSYGDQGWAYRGGHPNAIYAAITPQNWAPDPREDVDQPLAYITV